VREELGERTITGKDAAHRVIDEYWAPRKGEIPAMSAWVGRPKPPRWTQVEGLALLSRGEKKRK